MLKEVLTLRKEILGAIHPDTIMVLANTYNNLGRPKEAQELHEEMLKLRKEIQGDRHPDTIVTSNNLAHCYLTMGRAKDAEALQLVTLRQAQDILGNKHPTTAILMLTLAEIYESLRKKSDVLKLLDAAEAIFSERVEKDPQHISNVNCSERACVLFPLHQAQNLVRRARLQLESEVGCIKGSIHRCTPVNIYGRSMPMHRSP
jgi:tetratricopeptide (TPR) repeat protein